MRRLSLLLVTLVASVGFATSYRALELGEMLAQTELAFYGEVRELSVEERSGEPWTMVTFEVRQPLFGLGADDSSLSLAFYGGELPNGVSLSVSLMPQFEVGETVLVLAYQGELYSPIVGFRQGLWRETALGLRDETGRLLSLSEEGELLLDGEGGATEALLEALRSQLEDQP